MARCPRCKERERAAGQAWCRACLTEYQRERRKVLRAEDLNQSLNVGCPVCVKRQAAVRAAFEAFVRDADKGLLARLRWAAFREKVMDLL